MILSNLRLQNFKNYSDCSFTFNHGLNFIYGDNGNGKTNLLEAISFLCFTKSFLQNIENDCVKYGAELFDVSGVFENSLKVTNKLAVRYDTQPGVKKVTLNSEPIGRLSGFFGTYPLVVLAPQDMKLTSGTPAERRRNFDILISQVSRLYFDDLKNYNKVIKQKNALLKENLSARRYPTGDLQRLIEPWNEELVSLGSRIIVKRIQFVREFGPYLRQNFLEIVGNAYEPTIDYDSETELSEDIDKMCEELFKKLIEHYHTEISRGISLVGPHRDNYRFGMNKADGAFDVKTFASQGEHKTYIVSLKFAEYKYLNDKLSGSTSGEPMLLLDDVYSDLDKTRIERICSILPMYSQVFLTTTNPDYLGYLNKSFNNSNISSFKIVNGSASDN